MSAPDHKYEKLIGLLIEGSDLFSAGSDHLCYLQPLLKKGFTDVELARLINELKKDHVIIKDDVVGDGEFDRVVELDPLAVLRQVRKD